MSIRYLGACLLPDKPLRLPLFIESVQAGFPSPAQDYVERCLDLNELCIRNAPATFFVRAEGDSMTGAGIQPGDILIVDRSLEARNRDIVIAGLNGELTLKRLLLEPRACLQAENPAYESIDIGSLDDLEIFGVVTYVIHDMGRH